MTNLKHLFAVAALGTVMTTLAQSQVDLQSDTWVGVDALNRVLPTVTDAPLKTDKDRIVSIFYVSWHTDDRHSSEEEVGYYGADVTKVLKKDPEARKNMYNNAWEWQKRFPCHHWGEPEDGYFLSADPYIIRKDISMLNDAGVDLLVLDCTNGVRYVKEWDALLEVLETMRSEGTETPQVCFWVYNGHPTSRAKNIYDYYYTGNRYERYKDFYFVLDGKPLLLCNMDPKHDAGCALLDTDTGYRFEDYGEEVINFFTMRNMWWGYYYWPLDSIDPKDVYVGKEDKWTFGYDMQDIRINLWDASTRASYHNGEVELFSVFPEQCASSLIGKSWKMKKGQGVTSGDYNLNEYDMPKRRYDAGKRKWLDHPEDHGLYFEQRWNETLAVDPKIIFINDWNEWTAGMFGSGPYNFMGRQDNSFMFVDQYNAEFNRTVMPMKDGYTDNYYMQMIQNIRKYKGVRPAPVATERHSLRSVSDFELWNDVAEEYYDTYGDVAHRDYDGYGGMHYVNTSGRNDFLSAKVAVDNDVISFYVRTDKAITSRTDPNWMLLFINTDRDFSTGWGGFDYIVNKSVVSDSKTSLMAWDKESSTWVKTRDVDYRVDGNRMVVEIPVEAIGLSIGTTGGVYFKWADNPQSLDDPIDLCVNGDTAPNRRFCYDYSWNLDASGIDEISTGNASTLVAKAHGNGLYVETSGVFTVANVSGLVLAKGTGTTLIPNLDSGLYIVSNGRSTVKVVL